MTDSYKKDKMNLLRKTHKRKDSKETSAPVKSGKSLVGKALDVGGRKFKVKELLGEGTGFPFG